MQEDEIPSRPRTGTVVVHLHLRHRRRRRTGIDERANNGGDMRSIIVPRLDSRVYMDGGPASYSRL